MGGGIGSPLLFGAYLIIAHSLGAALVTAASLVVVIAIRRRRDGGCRRSGGHALARRAQALPIQSRRCTAASLVTCSLLLAVGAIASISIVHRYNEDLLGRLAKSSQAVAPGDGGIPVVVSSWANITPGSPSSRSSVGVRRTSTPTSTISPSTSGAPMTLGAGRSASSSPGPDGQRCPRWALHYSCALPPTAHLRTRGTTMVSDHDRRVLYTSLSQTLGEHPATLMMDLLPPVGWDDVARQSDLVATRGEMSELRGELKGELSELRGDMAELRGDMAELRGEMAELRGEMRAMFPKFIAANIASMVGLAGLVLAAGALL